ncbi:hypothetical protein EWI07_07040 [Sporolactobacillus sp. THM7-4]|nr:hypothetical protein EWI07_07040 [Sporolactobacillus sp. THM7-4]
MVAKRLSVPFLSVAVIVALLFVSAIQAHAASVYYSSSNFSYGVYLGGSNPTTFNLDGTAHFTTTQSAVYSGDPTGVKYQIRDNAWGTDPVYKSTSLYGQHSGYTVRVDGPTGYHNAYLRNAYSTDTPQKAHGYFSY